MLYKFWNGFKYVIKVFLSIDKCLYFVMNVMLYILIYFDFFLVEKCMKMFVYISYVFFYNKFFLISLFN